MQRVRKIGLRLQRMKYMKLLDYLKNNLLYLDGGMGTLLQAEGLQAGEHPERWNYEHPEVIVKLQKMYFDAGTISLFPIHSVQIHCILNWMNWIKS